MNTKLLVISLFQIGAGLILGTILLFIGFKLIGFWARKIYKIEQYNTSFAILIGGVLFSIGYFIKSIVEPLITTFRYLLGGREEIGEAIGTAVIYILIYFSLAFVFSFIVIVISFFLFTLFTQKLNEMEEIRNNNIAIGIILAVVIIVISLIVGDGFTLLTESIIPFPKLPKGIG
ncbi:MAG: DUF350 domain-containing protein [Spirochaetales bacterium]|nr:DUF350 domain-containing protein [Spirochaetales bacterium]